MMEDEALDEVFEKLPDIDTSSAGHSLTASRHDFDNSLFFPFYSDSDATFLPDIDSTSSPRAYSNFGDLEQEVSSIRDGDGLDPYKKSSRTMSKPSYQDSAVQKMIVKPTQPPNAVTNSPPEEEEQAVSHITTTSARSLRHASRQELAAGKQQPKAERRKFVSEDGSGHQLVKSAHEAQSESQSVDFGGRGVQKAKKSRELKALELSSSEGSINVDAVKLMQGSRTRKATRMALNPEAVVTLCEYFQNHPEGAPRDEQKRLASTTKLTEKQVRNWFSNRKQREATGGFGKQHRFSVKLTVLESADGGNEPSPSIKEARRARHFPSAKSFSLLEQTPEKSVESFDTVAQHRCEGQVAESKVKGHASTPRQSTRPRKKCLNSAKQKGERSVFLPTEAKHVLAAWLDGPQGCLYPKREEVHRLSEKTGLTPTQVANWFAGKRRG